jgi:hypothetical protein
VPDAVKLAFLCDGLEPGANGLGDMVRHYVPYLRARGIECLLVAMNDRAISRVESDAASRAHFGAPILRIPHRTGYAACTHLVRERLARFQPDWLSLQFVSYGFAKKGIVLAEPFWMPRAIGGFPLHVMMHELWVGHGVFRTPRMALIGALQKRAVRLLLERLRPRVVTTSCLYYAELLQGIGVAARTIPLCGNVKVGDQVGAPWLEEALRAGGIDLARRGRRHYWLFGLFGSILRQWQPDALFARLAALARSHGRQAAIVCAGETGRDTALLLADWRRRQPEILFGTLGRRSEAELSAFFNDLDFGLTSHPHYTAGKSGSIAAMLEHGLPTITSWGFEVAPALAPIAGALGANLWRADAALEAKLLEPPRRVRIYDGAGRMAQQLLDELASASPRSS